MRLGKDRRGAKRTQKYQLIKLKVEGAGKVVSFLRDISASGALFHSKVEFPKGEIINVFILSPAENVPVCIASRVVRSRSAKKIEGFDIGVEFEKMAPSDKDYLCRMLSSLKKSGR